MILPSKHISQRRSLVGVGARLLVVLDRPQTVSAAWHRFSLAERKDAGSMSVTYDWFVLALDLLFAMGCVELVDCRVARTTS